MRRTALVTGASAGIGEAFARLYAGLGHDLVLTARRRDRLERLGDELRASHGVRVLVTPADLAVEGAPETIIAGVREAGMGLDVLVNNAGYGLGGGFGATDWENHARFMQVMVSAPTRLAHLAYAPMVRSGYGRIINVASLAGILPGGPGHTLYAASKAYLIRLSESLHAEGRAGGVHVSALCPGFTFSEFHDVNQTRAQLSRITPSWMWMNADAVARAGWEACEKGRVVCVPGAVNRGLALFAKLAPHSLAYGLMGAQSARAGRTGNAV